MSDSVVEIDKLTDEAKNKLRDFDELEAYFLLCEIFSNAQTTKDYARFQSDLAEWKKRYPIDLFSDELKRKIKYMLSKEFIETVLKDFAVFEALSKKDPAKGLEKLRDVLDKAEKHKDRLYRCKAGRRPSRLHRRGCLRKRRQRSVHRHIHGG